MSGTPAQAGSIVGCWVEGVWGELVLGECEKVSFLPETLRLDWPGVESLARPEGEEDLQSWRLASSGWGACMGSGPALLRSGFDMANQSLGCAFPASSLSAAVRLQKQAYEPQAR